MATVIFGPGGASPAAIVEDLQGPGTVPQSVSSTSTWVTLRLTSVTSDPTSMVSLASNQVTLPAGSYLVFWFVPGANAVLFQTRLRNVTDSTTVANGQSSRSGDNSFVAPNLCFCSTGVGEFSVGASKALELQFWTNASTTKIGSAGGSGENEIYTYMQFIRLS